MASREHSFTRRAVLGAAVAMPVAATTGGALGRPLPCLLPTGEEATSAPREWITALAAFCWAEADLKAFERRTSRASLGPHGRSFDEQETLDEAYADSVDAADAAMLRLLAAPVPDLDALVIKIGLIAKHLVWELEGGEDCLVWLEADARRLAGQVKDHI